MFSARKTKAAPPRQQSVAPQIERSTTGSSLPSVPDQNLVKKFGPHRLSDGDSPAKDGQNSDEVSLSFKGEQFQGFSVFASPAPPVRRKSSKDLK